VCPLQFNTALQANTWSSFNILKGAAKAMMKNKKGGSIVLTSASGASNLLPLQQDAILSKV